MKKYIFLAAVRICFFFGLVQISIASGAYVCVGPSPSGNGSGSDWNNQAQWSTVALTRGNIYYLADGTYGSKTLDTAVSDSTYIYIKKATVSAHGTDMGWSRTYGDGVATFDTSSLTVLSDYWDIDGVTGGGPAAWTTGHGIAFTTTACDSRGFINILDARSNINVSHISFTQAGNTENCPGCSSSGPSTHGIYSPTSVSNSKFSYLYGDNLTGMIFVLRNGTGNIIEYNYSGNIGGASVCNPDFHTETIVMWAMNDTDIRFNFFTEAPSSGGIVRNGLSDTTSDAMRIYGNVIGNGGNLVCVNYGNNTNWRIFNNTFYNGVNGPLANGGAQSWTYLASNNVAYNFSYGYPPGDYSSFYQLGESQCTSYAGSYASARGFIVRMPIDCDYPDRNYNRDPFVNSAALDFRLSAPEDAGADACAVAGITCDAAKPYNKDMLGNTRTNWSRGAYEYVPGGDTTPPAAPAGLVVR